MTVSVGKCKEVSGLQPEGEYKGRGGWGRGIISRVIMLKSNTDNSGFSGPGFIQFYLFLAKHKFKLLDFIFTI